MTDRMEAAEDETLHTEPPTSVQKEEMKALNRIVSALESLEPSARLAAIQWLNLRYLKSLILLLAALLFSAPVSAQSLAPSFALIGGSTADLLTTLSALRSVPGAHEANPLLSHGGEAGLIAVKVGVTGALVYSIVKLMPRHRVLAYVIGFGGGAVLSGVAYRNARLK